MIRFSLSDSQYCALGLLWLAKRFGADDGSVTNVVSTTHYSINGVDPLDCLVKDTLQIPLRERRAFEVLDCPNILCDLHGLVVGDGRHFALSELLADFGVVAQIQLGSYKNDGYARSVMLDFGIPLDQSQRGDHCGVEEKPE